MPQHWKSSQLCRPVGAASKGETQDVTTAGEQPARSPVGAANEGGTHW